MAAPHADPLTLTDPWPGEARSGSLFPRRSGRQIPPGWIVRSMPRDARSWRPTRLAPPPSVRVS